MRKTSHLKKFIPVSILIHAAAIFAAGLVTAPLILKQDTSVEMDLGTGEYEQAETLGIDVLATQGTHQESSTEMAEAQPENSSSEITETETVKSKSEVAETQPIKSNSDIAKTHTVKSTPAKPSVSPLENSNPKNSVAVAPTAASTITSEELSIPVAKEEPMKQEVSQDSTPEATPPVAVAITLPEEKAPEEAPSKTPETTTAEIAKTASEESKPTPIAVSSTADTAKSESKSNESEKSEIAATKNSEGMGAGTNGANAPSQGLAGSATGIKSLEQLRQRAGNPKPRYDRDERLRGDKGTVVFKAYINQAGQPVKIEKITSSGHPNLDSKSLVALEKWKFEPGQEGWVEVPFKWDLKGESQSIGGSLRRSAANPTETP